MLLPEVDAELEVTVCLVIRFVGEVEALDPLEPAFGLFLALPRSFSKIYSKLWYCVGVFLSHDE